MHHDVVCHGGLNPVGPAPLDPEAARLQARAVAAAGMGAWVCDLADDTLAWTAGTYGIFGLEPGERIDRRAVLSLYAPESRHALERLRRAAILRGQGFVLEAEIVRPDGARRWMRLTTDVVRENGRSTRLYGTKHDITADRQRLEALRRLAEHDALTGLANRAAWEARFLAGGCGMAPVGPLGAVVLVDLDRFKQVNDTLGHLAGDACLRAAAERLQAAFPDAALTARIGGDEFALLLAPGPAPGALRRAVDRLLVTLSCPVLWNDRLLPLGASAGIAPVADPLDYDPQALFAAADKALYAAKAAGRGTAAVARA